MLLTLDELKRAIASAGRLEIVPSMRGPYGRHVYIASGWDLDALLLDHVQDDCQLISFLPKEGQGADDFRAAVLQVARDILAAWGEEGQED